MDILAKTRKTYEKNPIIEYLNIKFLRNQDFKSERNIRNKTLELNQQKQSA